METLSKKRLSLGSIGRCIVCGEKVWVSDDDGFKTKTGNVFHTACFRGDKLI